MRSITASGGAALEYELARAEADAVSNPPVIAAFVCSGLNLMRHHERQPLRRAQQDARCQRSRRGMPEALGATLFGGIVTRQILGSSAAGAQIQHCPPATPTPCGGSCCAPALICQNGQCVYPPFEPLAVVLSGTHAKPWLNRPGFPGDSRV
jgi:hypothetical protein